MTDKTRIKIAATITALFLAGISTVGLAARTDNPQTPAASAPAPTAAKTPTGSAQAPTSAPAGQATTYEDEGYDNEEREDDD